MIARTNRTPTFVLAGLIIAVLVLTYNYWTSIKQNNELMKQLNNMAVRVTDITNKKATIDKQNEALSSRIKYFEERAEANQQAINKKDDEMNQLNNKLKEALSQSDSFKLKNDEFSSKLLICDSDKQELEKVKSDRIALTDENTRLSGKVIELNNKIKTLTSECEIKSKSEIADLFVKVYRETSDESLKTKLKQIFKIDDKTIEDLKQNLEKPSKAKIIETPKNDSEVKVVENKRDIEEKISKTEKATEKAIEKVTEKLIVQHAENNAEAHVEAMITAEGNHNVPVQLGENIHQDAGEELEVHENDAKGVLLQEHKNEDDEHK